MIFRCLPAAVPAHAHSSENRLSYGDHRSSTDVVFRIRQVLSLEEDIKPLGQRPGYGAAQDKTGPQRQQILIVIEFVALGTALNGDKDLLRRRPSSLESEYIARYKGDHVADERGIGRKAG